MSTGALRSYIHSELGIMMPPSKEPLLQARLQRRLQGLGLRSLDDYLRHLRSAPDAKDEMRQLIGAVTTNTTEFFREVVHLNYLVDTLLPERLEEDDRSPFLVWSAGCSSGEEPYSIAMLLTEAQRRAPDFEFAVLGTDISPRVLDHAKRAVYENTKLGGIPKELAARYTMRAADPRRKEFRISPDIRAKVAFRELNFMWETYPVPTGFDVIYFRNVAIYFDQPTQEAVVRRLTRHLRPGGYLLLAQTESLVGRDVPVEHVGPATYRRPEARA